MDTIHSLLQTYFGYSSFRPLQKEIITDILHAKDVLAIMPTGSGKSLCYQVPALVHQEKITIVVSPLIALMKDQVDGLRLNGIKAAYFNSTLSAREQKELKQNLIAKQISLLYVAPERLTQDSFLEFLQQMSVNLFAIDEAHCISEWGHDFRPEYRSLRKVRKVFPGIPIIALTATATKKVQEDILTQLSLIAPKQYQASFDRPNLTYLVLQKQHPSEQVLEYLQKHAGESGIIYCQSRVSVDALAKELRTNKIKALAYHAGLTNEQRQHHQEQFIQDDIDVIVATIAFGMGINKPNVRFVIHYDLPGNIERYYQETGRAGRDGLSSECLLLYSYADKRKTEFFIRQKDMQQQTIAFLQLKQMIKFATYSQCRRKALLEYFDEQYTQTQCNACDNCITPKETFDATIITQKILSCVYRVDERFGISHIIDILTGKQSPRITNLHHDKLSTYGIITDYTTQQMQSLMRELIDTEYLQIAGDQYPIVRLAQKGKHVLLKKEKVFLSIPVIKEATRKKHRQLTTFNNNDLFQKLRLLRKSLADQQHVPPYVIFPDTSLREMATVLPENKIAFHSITGVGEKKLELYAGMFLKEIQKHIDSQRIAIH